MQNRDTHIFRSWPWLLLIGLAIGVGSIAAYSAIVKSSTPEEAIAESAAKISKPAAVTVVEVTRQEVIQSLTITGSLVAREEVLVVAQVSGVRLETLLADTGDRVKEGQVLARLDRATLETKLAENTSEIAKAEAAVKQATALITELEAVLAEARLADARGRKLSANGVLSRETMQTRETALLVAEARLNAQRENVAFAEASRAFAEAQRLEIKLNLSRTEVTAPTAGIVMTRNAKVGQIVSGSGDPMFRIIRDGAIELDAEVVESKLDLLSVGQPAALRLSGQQPIAGEVRLIEPSVDPESRLGRVRIALQPDPRLRPGRFVTAVIEVQRREGLVVPTSAISFGPDGPSVLAVTERKASRRIITTGLSDASGTEILTGLIQGEIVVAKAGSFLRNGEEITPVFPAKTPLIAGALSRTEVN